MERDRETTRNKLMDAVERIAVRDGFEACGVNAIAQEASVDKVLIYRYFGGVDGLLSAVVAERAAWPDAAPLGDGGSPGSALSAALIDQVRRIRARPLAQHAVAWEAAGHDARGAHGPSRTILRTRGRARRRLAAHRKGGRHHSAGAARSIRRLTFRGAMTESL